VAEAFVKSFSTSPKSLVNEQAKEQRKQESEYNGSENYSIYYNYIKNANILVQRFFSLPSRKQVLKREKKNINTSQ
jgi:hypothetical protein